MAEYVKVPTNTVHLLPADFPLKLGAFVEPAAVGVHAVSRSGYRPGDSAVAYTWAFGVTGLVLFLSGCALGMWIMPHAVQILTNFIPNWGSSAGIIDSST